MADSLRAQGAGRLARGMLHDVERRAEAFGFHLARLDLRQHSRVNAEALAELLRAAGVEHDYLSLSEAERTAVLVRELKNPRPLAPPAPRVVARARRRCSPSSRPSAACRRSWGRRRCNVYIVSMTAGVSDVLTPLLFAKEAGVFAPEADPPVSGLQMVPLFETIDDLRGGGAILTELLSLPVYRRHLQAWGGLPAGDARLLGQQQGRRLRDVQLGAVPRPGRAGRGLPRAKACACSCSTAAAARSGAAAGRPTARSWASRLGSVDAGLRMTEQGEVAFARYGNTGIAHRHLEQTLNAVLRASLRATAPRPPAADWLEAMDALSAAGHRAYRALVHDDPDFLAYFRAGDADRPGGRPAHRIAPRRSARAASASRTCARSRGSSAGRRAGTGCRGGSAWAAPWRRSSATAAARDRLKAMHREWPFFRSLIDNAQTGLGRSDRAVARLYAGLAEPDVLRDRILGAVLAEWDRTERGILAVTGTGEILEDTPVLRRSIRLRNPYVDPMSLVQVTTLRRLRAMAEDDPGREPVRDLVALSVNGIAAGLQNTG